MASYADKSRGLQGFPPEVGLHEASWGKQTLVAQIVAPVVDLLIVKRSGKVDREPYSPFPDPRVHRERRPVPFDPCR